MVTEIPVEQAVIGTKQIIRKIKNGKIKKVVLAKNCPDFLLKEMENLKIKPIMFDGDQKQLGTKLGKPFPVTMVGYPE